MPKLNNECSPGISGFLVGCVERLIKIDMSHTTITLSHDEISLLLFALHGGGAAPMPDASSCEEACPVVESVEELLCGGKLDPEQQLVRHLNNHLREAMIESGMFELMAATQPGADQAVSVEDPMKLQQVNDRLSGWTCQIKLDDPERRLLYESLSRLPRSSWVTMPRIIWRLRKKLKAR
jgi:hypothetical protein